jgi:hypothetical protein
MQLAVVKKTVFTDHTCLATNGSYVSYTVTHNLGRLPNFIQMTAKYYSNGMRIIIPDFEYYSGTPQNWYLEPTVQPVDFNNSFTMLIYHLAPIPAGTSLQLEINMEWI